MSCFIYDRDVLRPRLQHQADRIGDTMMLCERGGRGVDVFFYIVTVGDVPGDNAHEYFALAHDADGRARIDDKDIALTLALDGAERGANAGATPNSHGFFKPE